MINSTLSVASFTKASLRLSLSFIFFTVTFLSITSASYASDQEYKILQSTNQQRKKVGLRPLVINEKLMNVARSHSAAMAKAGKMSHNLHGQDLVSRVKKSGYGYVAIGENIGQSASGRDMVKMWMNSYHHKQNILNREFRSIGIGIAVAPNGTKYYTQVFGKVRVTY
jgi:uncharacterized protein YkwD